MISAWTKHLKSEEEKTKFKNSVLGSRVVLERLQELINEIEDEQTQIERSPKLYDMPNWDYRQAHLNGFKDCLLKIKKIITIDQKDNK